MAGAASDQAAAPKTAAFPPNGPGLRPEFDGVELLLMDHATPPETLLANLSRLGAVLDSPKDGVPAEIAWPDMTPELAEALSVDSITTWDYDLMKLNQVRVGRAALLALRLRLVRVLGRGGGCWRTPLVSRHSAHQRQLRSFQAVDAQPFSSPPRRHARARAHTHTHTRAILQLTKGKPLAPLAFALIESYDLIGKLNLDENTLKRYLVAFESAYNTCMYHNPMHAADVMHAFS